MRMAFGLVGLLVTLGIIILIFHYIEAPSLKVAGQTNKKVQDWAGTNNGNEGLAETKASIDLDEVNSGGNFNGFLVKSITPGGPMALSFDLKAGDTIIAIGGIRMRDNKDPDLSLAQLFDAKVYNRS